MTRVRRFVGGMRNPWNMLRCWMNVHRWETIRAGADKGRECRDCRRRVFDTPGGSHLDEVTRGASQLGGMGGISGSM
jgi:hypothetical protein